ncbi:MAG: DMT family transporter [Bacteroidales bacterium]|nr:DMT family transporter [Bacteroides sp.]MCM1502020.1 DMT family transporter [Bacteroidales bacterium]
MKKERKSVSGIADAIISSSSFGLSPFFSVSLLMAGLSTFEVLTYRWGVATFVLTAFALVSGKSLKTDCKEFGKMSVLSIFRALTSMFLIYGYGNIASGIASTIHFMYPIVVAVSMMFLFGERKSPVILTAAVLSLIGAYLLASGDSAKNSANGNVAWGIISSACSVFCYSTYIILLKKTGADKIDSTKLTCYVMGLSTIYFFIAGSLSGGVRLVTEPGLWFYIIGISVLCTSISNFFLVTAVKKIGPTLTSVFGALEPLTAVIIGAIAFSETLTASSIIGMLLIVTTVTIAAVHQKNA